MARFLRPLAVSATPTPDQLTQLARVLDDPSHCLLPVTDDADGARIVAAARVADPLVDTAAGAVLAVATTGSTGTPKIVLHSRSSLLASIDATAARLGGHGSWLLCLGISHIAGIQVVLRSAVAGIPPVVCPAGGAHFADDFAAATDQLHGDRRYVSLVPTQLQRLLDAGADLASFDAILLGGAAADPTLLERARDAGAHVVTTYGMSETGGGCVYDGEPLDGLSMVIDKDGAIRLTGPMVGLGYREPVTPDPFWRSDLGLRTFTTSDLGVIANGRLRVLGRADDIINTGGKKVSPSRVERALRSLPAIADAIVLGIPDDEWGQRVVALVTEAPTHSFVEPLAATIRSSLRDQLAAHEMPREVRVVEALPYKGIGKPDRASALAVWGTLP